MRHLPRSFAFSGMVLAGTLLLQACSEQSAPAGAGNPASTPLPIDDPGEAILMVFENDVNVPEGYCKPILKLALKTDSDSQRLRYHVLLDGQPYLQMAVAKPRNDAPFAYTRQKMTPHQPIEKACADIAIEVKELVCANAPDYYLEDCGRELELRSDAFASVADIRQ